MKLHFNWLSILFVVFVDVWLVVPAQGELILRSINRSVEAEATCGAVEESSNVFTEVGRFNTRVEANASGIDLGCDESAFSMASQDTFVDSTQVTGFVETSATALVGDSSATSMISVDFEVAETTPYQLSAIVEGRQVMDIALGPSGGVLELVRLPVESIHRVSQPTGDPFLFDLTKPVSFDFSGALDAGEYRLSVSSNSFSPPPAAMNGRVEFELLLVPEPTGCNLPLLAFGFLFMQRFVRRESHPGRLSL